MRTCRHCGAVLVRRDDEDKDKWERRTCCNRKCSTRYASLVRIARSVKPTDRMPAVPDLADIRPIVRETPCMSSPDQWFPANSGSWTTETRQAAEACMSCWYRPDCLATARAVKPTCGIWGGVRFGVRGEQ